VQKHLIIGTVGLLLGIAAIFWIRPDTDAGATMLVLMVMLLCQALGLIVLQLVAPRARSALAGKKLDRVQDVGPVVVDKVVDRKP